MSLAIAGLVIVIFIFSLTFAAFDISQSAAMRHDVYESVRIANQNALLDVQEEYNTHQELTQARLIEEWIVNFLNNTGIEYSEVKLKFSYLSTEPPIFTVEIEGHAEAGYVMFNGVDAEVKYYSSSTIITDED